MTEKQRIEEYKNVLTGKDTLDYSEWRNLRETEIKNYPNNVIRNKIKECEVIISNSESKGDSAFSLLLNFVIIMANSLVNVVIGAITVFLSVNDEILSKILESFSGNEVGEIIAMIFSNGYFLILLCAALFFIPPIAFLNFCDKRNACFLSYHKEMLDILVHERERRNTDKLM